MHNNGNYQRKTLAVAVTAACMTMSSAPYAQGTDDDVLEEIMVTATRREARVQDIPYNISAMSGGALETLNAVNQYDVLRAMHGVTVVDRGYRNAGTVNSIVIRGLNVDSGLQGDVMLNAVPTVATYYDNTPLFANFLVKDVDRVEVLRGPQGTLYGSGSLGGTVRYIGNRPNPEEFEADLEVDFSQTSGSEGENVAFDAMVNIPLGETTALRAAYSRIDNDGVIDYVNVYQLNSFGEPLIDVNGTCVDPRAATQQQVLLNVGCFEAKEDADTVEIDYAKVSLRGEPSDTFSYQLSYQMQDDKIGSRRSTTLGDNNSPDPALFVSYGDDDSGQVLLEPSERDVEMASLDLEWDLGFATFTSTTSTYDHEGVGESDNGGLWASGGEIDGTSRDWNFSFYGGVWPRPMQIAERGYKDEAFVQEFRLVSNESDGKVDWLIGGFFMDQETSVYQLSRNPGMNLFKNACRLPTDPVTFEPICAEDRGIFGGFWPRFYSADLTEIDFEYRRDTDYEEMAIYGELTYHLTDAFRLTGGFRWFDNETVNNAVIGFPLPYPGFLTDVVPPKTEDDDDVLIKLNASWDLNEDTMVYATYSEGYRHGGAQPVPNAGNFEEPNADAINTYQSDSVTNLELGIKGGRANFRYTASLFHVDWDDPQLNTTTNIFGFFIAANGDQASTEGVELEVEGYLSDSFHYRVGYTYVDAELDKDFISPQTGDLVAPKGSQLPSSPQNVISLNVDNSWNINADLDLVAGLNLYYQDESTNHINVSSDRYAKFDSYSLLGLTASLVAENWTATLYARNLGDEEGVSGGFPTSYWSYDTGVFESWYGNGNRQFIVQPRTIGLKFGYRF